MAKEQLQQYLQNYVSQFGEPTLLSFDFLYARCRLTDLAPPTCYDYAHQRTWSDWGGPIMIPIAAGGGIIVGSGPELIAALTAAAAAARDRLGPAVQSPWLLSWVERGRQIEDLLERNLPQNYPHFDRYVNGVATSIKSLDLASKAYQGRWFLTDKLASYVDDIAGLRTMINWGTGTAQYGGQPITARILQVALPPAQLSAAQVQALRDAVSYGQSVGVMVQYVIVP